MFGVTAKKAFSFFVLFFLLTGFLSARIIRVPEDSSTIQAGIDGADEGDTVLVDRGTYYENINFSGKAVVVASHFIFDSDTNSIISTIIDGSQPADPRYSSVVSFMSGEDSLSVLKGFTLQSGTGAHIEESSYGGGIFCSSSPSILNNVILAGSAHFGGGICARGQNSSPRIAGNIVIGNQGVVGGGIFCEFSRPEIVGNLVQHNRASYRGGGIFAKLTDILIAGNRVLENESSVRGGGIHVVYSSARVTDNYVAFNQADQHGAGIYAASDSSLLIQRNIVYENLAQKGAGIYITSCSSQIANNTVNDNSADQAGGIFYRGSSYTEIVNNIVANSLKGGGLVCEQGSSVRVSFNDVWNNRGGDFVGCAAGIGDTSWGLNLNGTPCDTLYNIIQDPLFVSLDSNHHISCLSPCRDAGAPHFEVPSGGGERIDVGAFEFVPISGDVDGNEKIDIQDVLCLIGFLFRGKAFVCEYDIGDVNCNEWVDISDCVYLINFIFKEGPAPCWPD